VHISKGGTGHDAKMKLVVVLQFRSSAALGKWNTLAIIIPKYTLGWSGDSGRTPTIDQKSQSGTD